MVQIYAIITIMSTFIPDKTLFIRMSSIGDIILTTPALRSFKKKFPRSRLDFIVRREFAELLRHNPYIDNLYEFNTQTGLAGLQKLCERLKPAGYDLIVDAHNNLRSRYIRKRVPSRKTVRINKRIIPRFFLVNFKWQIYKDNVHVVDRYMEPLRSFGVVNDNKGLELHIPRETTANIAGEFRKIKSERTTIAALCPSAKHYTKRWLKEYYVELAGKLVKDFNAYIIMLGGPEDRAYCEDMRRLIGEEHVINVAGEVTLLQSAAILDHCDVVVTNDTGLMHIAVARQRNVVAIFGSTVKEFGFFPYGLNSTVVEHPDLPCRPCTHIGLHKCPKKHFRCMKEVTPDMVFDAVRRYVDID